jgi:hypothetical protein
MPSFYNAKTGLQNSEPDYADSTNVCISNMARNASNQVSSILMVMKMNAAGGMYKDVTKISGLS